MRCSLGSLVEGRYSCLGLKQCVLKGPMYMSQARAVGTTCLFP